MQITHKIETIDQVEQIILSVEYPYEYEFSLDFDAFKRNVSNIADKIREYAMKNIGNIKDGTVLVVLNGVVVGSLLLSQLATQGLHGIKKNEENLNSTPQTQIEQVIETSSDNKKEDSIESMNISSSTIENIEHNQQNSEPKAQEVKKETQKEVIKTPSNSSSKPPSSNTKPPETTPIEKPTVKPPDQSSTSERKIKLKLNNGSLIEIGLEDYVTGVVAAEMPAEFSSEALKAQAVAARTYALKKVESGTTLTATTSHQVYKTQEQLKAIWGNSFNTYYNKIKAAVNSTKGETMTYNGAYIDALYFSTSNGKTEEPAYVWGYSAPYLKSVDSKWDLDVKNFQMTKTLSMSDISQKLGVNLTNPSQIVIQDRTKGNRVNTIIVAGKKFSGVQIRDKLGLRSADFDISSSGNNIVFTTRGFGHGVGMSQYGANGMAKNGYSYTQILKHYYTGIQIKK